MGNSKLLRVGVIPSPVDSIALPNNSSGSMTVILRSAFMFTDFRLDGFAMAYYTMFYTVYLYGIISLSLQRDTLRGPET